MTFHDNVVLLADEFIDRILSEINDEDIDDCRSYIDCHPDSSTCPTHDHCDSNQLMIDAFRQSMGRSMNVCDPADHELSCAAWEMARMLRFRQHWTDTAQFCEWSESGVEVDDVGSPALACGQHALESGYSLCEGIAYSDGCFVTLDDDGVYVAPIGNAVIAGTLNTCERFLWFLEARNNVINGSRK